jgi:hypothetical protein
VGVDEQPTSNRTTRSSTQKEAIIEEPTEVPITITPIVTTPVTGTKDTSSPLEAVPAEKLEANVVITKPPGFDRSQYKYITNPYINEQVQNRKRSREESNMDYSEDE